MHPRQMKREPLADIRSFGRAPVPALVDFTPAPVCAFAALTTPHARIEVVRGFSIHLPFVGNLVLAYPAGTVVDTDGADRWERNAAMAIVARHLPGKQRGLVATPRHLMGLSDLLLGGFDLDGTAAVLAGSFWDANLDDVPASHGRSGGVGAAEPAAPTAQRIAEIFIERARDGFSDTTAVDLVREGISERDAMQHYEAGAGIAADRLRDTDVSADRVTYNRQQRVMLGANAVAGLLLSDTATVHTACRLAGLSTTELGRLFDDIIGEAMRLVREARELLVAVH